MVIAHPTISPPLTHRGHVAHRYADDSVKRRQQLSTADRNYKLALVPKCFYAWVDYVGLQCRVRALELRGEKFRSTGLLAKHLTW